MNHAKMNYEMLGYVSYHSGVAIKDVEQVIGLIDRYNEKAKDKQDNVTIIDGGYFNG